MVMATKRPLLSGTFHFPASLLEVSSVMLSSRVRSVFAGMGLSNMYDIA